MGNMTETFFGNLDAAATWSAGVAFKRSKALPLDKYSVFETKALAEEYAEKRGAYAETPVSYPGQVIVVSEGDKMVAYVLAEAADGTKLELQQIGIIPTGDDKTIAVTEDGIISLLATDKEVFKKDEEGNPTEEKVINAGAQLILQADGTIKWVQPDTSTAEGQAAAISALQDRTTSLEKADSDLDTAVKAAQKTADEATAAINDFLTGTGAEGVIDSLTEIQSALDSLTDASELATAIAGKADRVEGATEGNFAGLDADGNLTDSGKKATDFATAAQGATADNTAATVATYGDIVTHNATEFQAAGNYEAAGAAAQALADAKADTDAKLANYYNKTDIDGMDLANKTDVAAVKSAADAAKTAADAAQATANTNAANTDELEKVLYGRVITGTEEYPETVDTGLIGNLSDARTRLSTAEGTIAGHTAAINDINTALGNKAESTALAATDAKVAALESIVGKEAEGETPASGLVASIEALDSRLTAEETKADKDTTYTFSYTAIVPGVLTVKPSDNDAYQVDLGVTAVAETAQNAQDIATNAQDAAQGLSTDFANFKNNEFKSVATRVQAAEDDIDALQETIKGLSGAMHFKGVVTTDPTAEGFDASGYENGDVVIYGNKEYVFNVVDENGAFVEFGDATGNASAITELDGRVSAVETAIGEEPVFNGENSKYEGGSGIKLQLHNLGSQILNATTIAEFANDKADEARLDKIDEVKTVEGCGLVATTTRDETDEYVKTVTIGWDNTVTIILDGGKA